MDPQRPPPETPPSPEDDTRAPRGVQIYDRPGSADAEGRWFNPVLLVLPWLLLIALGALITLWLW